MSNFAHVAVEEFWAFTVHKGMRKHQITLHETADFASPSLALTGIEALVPSTSTVMLPAPPGWSSDVQVEKMKDKGGIRRETSGSTQPSDNRAVESCAWRASSGIKRTC